VRNREDSVGRKELCKFLDWDSEFFRCQIARIIPNRLTSKDIGAIFRWCRDRSIDCLYFLADVDDPATVFEAEANEFHLVDIRITLERLIEAIPSANRRAFQGVIRPSKISDVPALRAMAKLSHRDSRFYYDGRFSRSRCDALYTTWIEKSCNGYANIVFVSEIGGVPAGYVSCHLAKQARAQIGLLGVHGNFWGKGIGEGLLNESLRWFAEQGAKRVAVVTQGRNCSAQRLYERCGFVTQSVQLWYHRWFNSIRKRLPAQK